ncbi:hypothetical protein OsJ_01882 [Oryza sativa Japonica Group]|nr:hypothetical protein OsJ_01882 [Oryza sativa Japonica Group]
MSSTHIFLLPLRVQHGGRGASTSGSRDRAGKPLPPPQPQSLFVRSALLYYPHTPSIFVADLPLPCGLPVAVALDMCLRPVNHSRRSGVVPPDVSAEAEGDDLCDVFLEQQAHLPWRRPHLPVSPLASSSPHPLPSSSILYRHPLLFSSSSPSRKEAVESGTGRAGTASLISLAGRRQR